MNSSWETQEKKSSKELLRPPALEKPTGFLQVTMEKPFFKALCYLILLKVL